MTYKEAFDMCRDLPPTNYNEVCKKALEKQIPKKVKISLKGTTDLNTKCRCPDCGAFISNGKYCRECGQAIDWSDV